MTGPETTEADLLAFLDLCAELRIDVWLDGGWGVDALLGRQTRPHGDVDIVVQAKDEPRLRAALDALGFELVPTDDQRPWNYVLGHPDGRRVDFHVIVVDRNGDGIYGPPENGDAYPAAALKGIGTVGGRRVRCLTAEYQIESHTGYRLGPQDLHDVRLLHEQFGVPLAPEHRRRLESG